MASLGRSSVIFSAMTMISRVLGLVRDMLIARYFDTAITDPFFAAMRIPNTLRRFFAEGSFANAFVPVFSATRAEHPEKLRDLLAHTFGTLLLVLVIVTLFGVIGSATIISVVAHGLVDKPEQFTLASEMLRIMFPYILMLSLTAMAGGILNTHGQFAIPALTPVFLNLTLIGACAWRALSDAANSNGMELAWAVLLGGVLQLVIQVPFLWKLRLLLWPRWGGKHPGVRRILRLMGPTLFGSSVGQLSILLNTFLASMLVTGSISWLYYSDRLVELPIALVGVALGTVILPRLSALRGSDDQKQFVATLDWALRWALLVGSAASTGLVVLAPAMLATLFYGGKFAIYDVQMTTLSLRAYAAAAVCLILVKILAPAFYSRQNTRTPVKAGLIAVGVNMLAAVSLSPFFGHVGLAAASSVSSLVNVSLLLYFLQREGIRIKLGSFRFIMQVISANIAMALILFYLQGDVSVWLGWTRWQRIWHLALIIPVGMMAYIVCLYMLGLRWSRLKKR